MVGSTSFVCTYACTCALCAKVGYYTRISREQEDCCNQFSISILVQVMNSQLPETMKRTDMSVLHCDVPRSIDAPGIGYHSAAYFKLSGPISAFLLCH